MMNVDLLSIAANNIKALSQMHNDFMDLAKQYMQTHTGDTNAFADILGEEAEETDEQGPLDGMSLVDYIDSDPSLDYSLDDGGLLGMSFGSYLAAASRSRLGLQPTKSFDPASITPASLDMMGAGVELGIPDSVALDNTPRGPQDTLLPIINGLFSEVL